MPNDHTEQLQVVFCEVLQNMAFMFGDPVDKSELPADVSSCIEASMAFTGQSLGRITLLFQSDIAGELASNLLGLDSSEECSKSQELDAVGELLNVLLGQLLTAIGGYEAVFDLTPPEVREISPLFWKVRREESEHLGFLVDDYPILLEFKSSLVGQA